MRYISETIFLLVTTAAALTGEKIDMSVLKPCKHSQECLPWQVCASCTSPIFWGFMGAHLTKRWCSDVSDTGICHYQDEDYSCSCDEGEEHDPKRDEMMDVGKQVPEVFCKEDALCHQYIANSRCSHCAYATNEEGVIAIVNACTTSAEVDPNSYCHNSLVYMCSCGQRLPAPFELQPSSPQTQNSQPQQQKHVITAVNPPDLRGAGTVDLSAWAKQAVLGGSRGVPGADVASWAQDTGPAKGGFMDWGRK